MCGKIFSNLGLLLAFLQILSQFLQFLGSIKDFFVVAKIV